SNRTEISRTLHLVLPEASRLRFLWRIQTQVLSHGSIEDRFLFRSQGAVFPLRQRAEFERTYGHAQQPDDFQVQRGKHAANLPVLAFIEPDLEPTFLLARADPAAGEDPQEVSA